MKRGIAVLVSLSALVTVGYFTVSKWAIRHETITFNDPARDNQEARDGSGAQRAGDVKRRGLGIGAVDIDGQSASRRLG